MKRTMLASAVVALLAVLGGPVAVLAGGGCHAGATQQDATGSDEATVAMKDACFTPSITTVNPGTDVTFLSNDAGITHNVGGTLWGHYEDMAVGDAYTATFHEPGIYPFACSYHPGMTGAIVVGDGKGVGNGLMVSTTPNLDEPAEPDATRVASADASPAPWIAVAAICGLAIGAGAAFAIGRRLGRPASA